MSDLIGQFVDAYNRAEWDRLDALVTADYVHHNGEQLFDLDGFKRGALWIRNGLPDFRIEIADVIAEGDKAAVRIVGRGTHRGSFGGETPTSSDVVLHGAMIYRFQDGLIAEDWEAIDEQPILRLLG